MMAVTIIGCSDLEVEIPDFRVTMDSATVKAGHEVKFLIEGEPYFMTFYSGEDGHRYKYKDRIEAEGTPAMSFKNTTRWGAQENTLQILASANLSGKADAASIGAATWTDITSGFSLDANAGSWNFVESGQNDLSEFIGKPLYVAFKFTGTAGSTQRTWRISDFSIVLNTADGEVINVADNANPGFTTVDVEGEGKEWKWKNTYWEMAGGNASAPTNEDWLVAGPLNLAAVSPDKGVSQNSYTDKVSEIAHTYSSPGTYTATFLGINATVDDSKVIVKEITFEVQ